ncbi:hypothetical protein AX16_009508 [Volvariella volvacea WC 439]|nr:hypothetical protein AX16_009508 [Volvariella volvacea WC 439]
MLRLPCRSWLSHPIQLVTKAPSVTRSLFTGQPEPASPIQSSPPLNYQAIPISKPILVSLAEPLIPKKIEPSPQELCVALDPSVFNHPVRRDILHLCVVHYRDGLRQGSANTKTRGEVRGSGIKIRRQKGSGKARLGDGQSPTLVGGGVAFGPKPRDFSTQLPRKVIEMGMRVALSTKLKEQSLGIVSSLSWPNGKTKNLARRIDALGLRKTLFVTGAAPSRDLQGLERAIRNIPMVDFIRAEDLVVYDVLKWPRLFLDLEAVQYFEDTLGKDIPMATIPLTLP